MSFLRRTTRCIAVQNSSRSKAPSLFTSDSCLATQKYQQTLNSKQTRSFYLSLPELELTLKKNKTFNDNNSFKKTIKKFLLTKFLPILRLEVEIFQRTPLQQDLKDKIEWKPFSLNISRKKFVTLCMKLWLSLNKVGGVVEVLDRKNLG